jgi:hypothetical protein
MGGVKIYPDSESSAENGYIANIEIKYKLPQYNGLMNQVGFFYDIGRTYMNNSTNVSFDSKLLQDVGISYYGNYKNLFLKTHVAFRVGNKKITSEPDQKQKVLFQVGWVY